MPMFSDPTTSYSEAKPAVEEMPAVEETAASDEATQTKTKAKASKKVVKKPAVNKTAAKKTAAKKTDGRAASWQKYTRPGVKNESIPDAVQVILETQPKNEFKIADVMQALFKEDMPRAQYLKARNRISNVLSGGVRAGDWYKGDRGTYRMTEA